MHLLPLYRNPMKNAPKPPVRHNVEKVANVDNERTSHWRQRNPACFVFEDLEAVIACLVNDGEEGGVGVGSKAHDLVWIRARWIRVQLEGGVGLTRVVHGRQQLHCLFLGDVKKLED